MASEAGSSAVFVRALYSYNGVDSSSLSFRQGDVIEVLSTLESGWWDGVVLQTGVRGWFPSNYVESVTEAEALWTTKRPDPRHHRTASRTTGLSAAEDDEYNSMLAQLISTGSTGEEAPIHDFVHDRDVDLTSFSSGGDIFSEIAAAAQAEYASEPVQPVSSALGTLEEAEDDWEAHVTPAGNHFWFNRRTGETAQNRPGRLEPRARTDSYDAVQESGSKGMAHGASGPRPPSSHQRLSLSDDSDDSDLDTAFANPNRRVRKASDSGITRDFAQRFDIATPRPPSAVAVAEEQETPSLRDLEEAALASLKHLADVAGRCRPEDREDLLVLGDQAIAKVRDALRASSALDHGLLGDSAAQYNEREGLPAGAVAQLRPASRQVIAALSKLSFGLRALWTLPDSSKPEDPRFADARDDESPDEEQQARRQAAHAERMQRELALEARSKRDIAVSSQSVSERLSLFFQHLRGALLADRSRRGLPPLPATLLRAPYSLEIRLRATPRSRPPPRIAVDLSTAAASDQGPSSLAGRISTVVQLLRANQDTPLPLSAVAAERLLHLQRSFSELLTVVAEIERTATRAAFATDSVDSAESEPLVRSELSKLRRAMISVRNFMPSVLLAVQGAAPFEPPAPRSVGAASVAAAAGGDVSLNVLIERALADVTSLLPTVSALAHLLPSAASLTVPPTPDAHGRPQSLAAPSLDGSVNTPTSSSTNVDTHRSHGDASLDQTMDPSVRNSVDSDFFFSEVTTNDLRHALPDVEHDAQIAPAKAHTLTTGRDSLVGGTASSSSSGSGIEVLRPIPAVPRGWDGTRRGSVATWSTTSSHSYASPRSDSFPTGLDQRSSTRSSSKNIHKLLGEVPPEAVMREQPQAVPWYLERDWDDDDLSFTMDHTIRGGTLRGLVIAATSHEGRVDSSYLSAFLMTYRTFGAPGELLDELIRRYVVAEPEGLEPHERKEWEARKQRPIRARVTNLLKAWVREYMDHEDLDPELLGRIREFALTTVTEKGQSLQICKSVDEKLQGAARRPIGNLAPGAIPPPIIPRNLKKVKLVDIEPLELARQLTIMDSRLFQRITSQECLSKAWPKQFATDAPNISAMIDMSNAVTRWVTVTILAQDDLKKRTNLIKHFVSIAERCLSLNSFSILIHVIAGLNSTPIHRLRRTWEGVNQKTMITLGMLNRVMKPDKNYKEYREILRKSAPPCVPFLGVYLTDWTFIGDGNPDVLREKPHQINFHKRQKASELILMIKLHQATTYNLQAVPPIATFLQDSLFPPGLDLANEDQRLYEMSLALEPRERDDEKIARLLSESGFL